MVAVGTAFGVVLWFGFWIHEKGTSIPDGAFGLLMAVAIVAISTALLHFMVGLPLWNGLPVRFEGFEYRGGMKKTSTPVPQVDRRSAEQIAYDENPEATAACIHLEAIERAMRAAGIEVRRSGEHEYWPVVTADCRIHEAELRRVFALSETIFYKEAYQPERYEFDNPRADIFCTVCLKADRSRSDIMVLHPDECKPDTRWFPSPPEGPAGGHGR